MSNDYRDSDTVAVLEAGDKTYYLIGTAHVSEASVKEVRQVIEEVQPDTVCVELCQARYNALTQHNAWKNLNIFRVIKEGKTLFLLANLAIGAYQRRLGEELGVKPGAELLAGIKAAEEIGARVELIDRDIHVTLKRTWANLGFWTKVKLIGAVMGSMWSREQISVEDIEKLKQQGNLSDMLSEFAREVPDVKEPLIDERDQYLMSGIEKAEGKKIVAVVGAAHVPGMRENFGKEVDRAALERLPPPSRFVASLKWIIPLVILVAFSYGYSQDRDTENILLAWILPNSIMASLFTAIAGGKILSIITAFIASPITSLNPLLHAGIVVGLLEAWLRKPTVEDCENINQDVQSVRGIYRNPVTRVLLVAVMATLGSATGAWIGLGSVLGEVL
ncbi:MAG: TraB/GumN family protein [Proteobacteria bacterium]|nr:TraB/GumN family protein [Pseudomonadota bacterium]